jgi:hypothetical protein
MTSPHEKARWWVAFQVLGLAVFLTIVVMATTVLAGDSSYRRIVKQLRSEFRATEQSLYGGGILGGLAVAFIRPAGVSGVSFTILDNLDQAISPDRDFNRVIRSAVDAKWRPLVMYSAADRREWTHVYSHPDGTHIKLLIVNRSGAGAVVAEVKIDPGRLSAFIDNPKILGIRVGSRGASNLPGSTF